jgi:hypothetical protein
MTANYIALLLEQHYKHQLLKKGYVMFDRSALAEKNRPTAMATR